jgi:hypothetical protein
LQQVRSAAWQSASQAKAAVEIYLKSGRPGGTTLEAVAIEPPKLLKGETVIDAVERLRRRGRELRADLHRIQSAPFPSSYARAKMREEIEVMATLGEPDVSKLIEHRDRPIIWPTQQVRGTVYNAAPGAICFTELEAATPLVVWVLKDALIKRLDAKIDAEADDPASLSQTEREKRESEVMSDLLDIEGQESVFVWQAQSQGLPCEHRSDINPVALLGLRLVTTPRVNETPGTTPGLSWPWRR